MTTLTWEEGWRQQVKKVVDDYDADHDAPTTWTVNDYIGVLRVRDFLEDELNKLPAEERREAAERVEETDEFYRRHTEVSPTSVWELTPQVLNEASGQWWWRRAPSRGPIRVEMERWGWRPG